MGSCFRLYLPFKTIKIPFHTHEMCLGMKEAKEATTSTAFLLANWYSGATLLTLLLDRHPQIVSNGEGFYHRFRTGDTVCSCGESVTECPFYRHAAAGMWAGADYDSRLFSVTPPLFPREPLRRLFESARLSGRWRRSVIRSLPWLRAEYDGFVKAHVEFMRRALSLSKAELYLDGTKSLRRAEIFLSEEQFESSPLLLLVRHPLSWCASWMEKRKTADLDNAIRTWNEYVRRSFRLREHFPESPFRTVLYEDLCEHPTRELTEIERWLGLRAGGVLEPRNSTPHVLGNKMRFTFDGTVRPAVDRSNELTTDERTEILERCEDWMEAVGYNVTRE